MGRKKKQVEEVIEIPQEEKVEEILETSKTKSSLTYTGKIKVTLKKGDKVYTTKTFKNAGRWPLFRFFDHCLRGEYNFAEQYRPKFIDLFYIENAGIVPSIGDGQADTTLYYFYNDNRMDRISLTSYPYLTTPAITYINNVPEAGIGSCSVTYKFNIPFTQLATTDETGINLICLYGKANQGIYYSPSCFFFVTDEYGNLGNLLEGLVEPGMKLSDYSLFIE